MFSLRVPTPPTSLVPPPDLLSTSKAGMVALPSALLSALALPLAVGGPSEPALDVGGLKYLSWYECCKGTNQPGTPADGPNNRSDTGGFRGDEPGINLGTSGIPGTIEAVFKKHGVPSLFGLNDGPSGYSASGGRLPGVFSWAPKGWGSQNGKLADNWEAAVENITTEIRPLVDSGAIVGVWFGDELAAAGGLPFEAMDKVVARFRKVLGDTGGPGKKNKLIYYCNEAFSTVTEGLVGGVGGNDTLIPCPPDGWPPAGLCPGTSRASRQLPRELQLSSWRASPRLLAAHSACADAHQPWYVQQLLGVFECLTKLLRQITTKATASGRGWPRAASTSSTCTPKCQRSKRPSWCLAHLRTQTQITLRQSRRAAAPASIRRRQFSKLCLSPEEFS